MHVMPCFGCYVHCGAAAGFDRPYPLPCPYPWCWCCKSEPGARASPKTKKAALGPCLFPRAFSFRPSEVLLPQVYSQQPTPSTPPLPPPPTPHPHPPHPPHNHHHSSSSCVAVAVPQSFLPASTGYKGARGGLLGPGSWFVKATREERGDAQHRLVNQRPCPACCQFCVCWSGQWAHPIPPAAVPAAWWTAT
jgi:hypothetical protein